MEEFLTRLAVGIALQKFYGFTLVLVRMAGLMAIGPVFGQRIVPMNVRALLVFAMAVVVTPTLPSQSAAGFRRLDANGDGRLVRDEVPQQLKSRFDGMLSQAGKGPGEPLTEAEYVAVFAALEVPRSGLDYARVAVGEFALGLMLGLGVLIVLSALQLGGELMDQQTGFSLGEFANPGMEVSGATTGQFLYMMGVTLFLVMTPLNGHLLLVGSLVETFQTLPVGTATIDATSVDLLNVLVHQSLVLGIQVAAPLLAVMSLVALTMGFLGHTVPQLNILVIGFPIRVSIGLLILALTLTGAADLMVDAVPEAIDAVRRQLTGLP